LIHFYKRYLRLGSFNLQVPDGAGHIVGKVAVNIAAQ